MGNRYKEILDEEGVREGVNLKAFRFTNSLKLQLLFLTIEIWCDQIKLHAISLKELKVKTIIIIIFKHYNNVEVFHFE